MLDDNLPALVYSDLCFEVFVNVSLDIQSQIASGAAAACMNLVFHKNQRRCLGAHLRVSSTLRCDIGKYANSVPNGIRRPWEAVPSRSFQQIRCGLLWSRYTVVMQAAGVEDSACALQYGANTSFSNAVASRSVGSPGVVPYS